MSDTTPSPSRFRVDRDKCTACGACVLDCPARIIHIVGGVATVKPEDDQRCIRCQHCLAVCPYGAVGVDGKIPDNPPLAKSADPAALDALIRSRRSVRRFAPGGVDPDLLKRVLDTVAYAPTGRNDRHLRYTIVHAPDVMDELRDRTCRAVVANASLLPESASWLVDNAKAWLDDGVDVIFRTAPHLIVVTAGPDQACDRVDCVIALSYFDLYAQANGIGTVWCGMMDALLRFLPEIRGWLGIPDDHEIGYAMLFGPDGASYARPTQHALTDVAMVEKLG